MCIISMMAVTPLGRVVTKVALDCTFLFLVLLPWILMKTIGVPFHRGFTCNDESLRYPYKPSTVPSIAVTIVGVIGVPIFMVVTEGLHLLRHKPIEMVQVADFRLPKFVISCYRNVGIFLFGCAAQQTLMNIGKFSVGRLRPHFFDICQPDYSKFNCTIIDGVYAYITDDVCTSTDAHRMHEVRLSFPSGHSSQAIYCAVYFVLYAEARVTRRYGWMLRHFMQVLAMWLAIYVCFSRISDYKHHWSDVLGGFFIGAVIAILSGVFIAKLCRKPTENSTVLESGQGKYKRSEEDADITESAFGPNGEQGTNVLNSRARHVQQV